MVFILDAENELDIMDYWNFRAMGKNVVPLPIQTISSGEFVENICMRIKDIWTTLGGDPNSSERITVQKSRTIQAEAFKKCVDTLLTSLKSLGVLGSLSIRQWFPRIWEQQYQYYDEVECAEFEHKKKTVNQEHASDEISIPTPPLSVMDHHGFGDALYAIEVEFRMYGSESLYAEVIPETTNGLASDLGSIERKAWRFSNRGMIHLCRHVNFDARLKIPLGESVFKKWMSDRGWKVETSSPGKIGYHLLKHLKGLWGTAIFMNVNIMKMFSEMSGSRYKTYPEVRAFAERAVNESVIRWNSADRLIQQLLEVNAIQVGIELQCGMCSQRSWFPVTSFQTSVSCPKCLLEFKPPLENPRSINWAYRTIGPFNSPDHASGMFAVLLTLRFFSMNLNLSTTSHLSFTAQKGQLSMEADLGILYKREPYEERRTEPVPIFCECKSFNEFLKADFVRMKQIAQEFPGSIIVFSTLRESITRKEKSEIAKIARYGRKLSENLKPRNLVMVLTGDQMLAHHWPPDKWKDAGEPFSSASTAYGEGRVEHICEVSQKIYLGLEGLRQYVEAEVEKRRKKTKEVVSN